MANDNEDSKKELDNNNIGQFVIMVLFCIMKMFVHELVCQQYV